ncbi:MAG: hypothetical protein ACLUHK_04415 [Eubacteriales bacterium]
MEIRADGHVAEVNYTVSAPIDLTDTLFATVDLSEEFTALDFRLLRHRGRDARLPI